MKIACALALSSLAAAPLAAQAPCHAENDGNNFNDAVSMGGPNILFAIRFAAPANLTVTSIEVFTGEESGQNSVSIWTHDQALNVPVSSLGIGTWDMSFPNGWQGATLAPSISLSSGTTYWFVWGPQEFAQASVDLPMAFPGQVYRASFDGGNSWNGPWQFNTDHWKFRLYCEPPAVTSFCTSKPGLACGMPSIFSVGVSSTSANAGFVIAAQPARGERLGVLHYTPRLGAAAAPFQGGTLCIATQQLRRGGPTSSLGTNNQCDGMFVLDMNTFAKGLWTVPPSGAIPANNPAPYLLTVGQQVFCQYWGRDTVASGSFLSNGVTYTVGP
jgi:hypothetical protein